MRPTVIWAYFIPHSTQTCGPVLRELSRTWVLSSLPVQDQQEPSYKPPPPALQGNCMLLFIPSFHTDTVVNIRSHCTHQSAQTHIIAVIFLSFCRLHADRSKSSPQEAGSAGPEPWLFLFCEYSETSSSLSLTAWWRTSGDWGLARRR